MVIMDWQFSFMVIGILTCLYLVYKLVYIVAELIYVFLFRSYPNFQKYGHWAGMYIFTTNIKIKGGGGWVY